MPSASAADVPANHGAIGVLPGAYSDSIGCHTRSTQGIVTDLLIGDLFDDKVDRVWQPMESLYPPGKTPIAPWFAGTSAADADGKANELVLPEGRRP